MSAAKRLESVVLRDRRGAGGLRHLEAAWREDGSIVIQGQDLGSGVEQAFGAGNREYEWAWSIGPEAVPAMIAALGGSDGEDPLPLLRTWHDANGSVDPGSHLRKAGVPVEFWSRVGD